MNIFKLPIIISISSVFIVCPVMATAQGAPSLDGKIDLGSDSYFSYAVGDPGAPDFAFDEIGVRKLVRHLLRNHRLEAEEIDALRELVRDDISNVSFTINATTHTVPVTDNEGRRIIGLVLNPVDMDALWANGSEGIRTLAELHGLSRAHANNIDKFTATKIHPAWKKSNISNGYEPLRQALGTAHLRHQSELGDDHFAACNMYFGGVKYLDAYLKDSIPDYRYDWLEAKKHKQLTVD